MLVRETAGRMQRAMVLNLDCIFDVLKKIPMTKAFSGIYGSGINMCILNILSDSYGLHRMRMNHGLRVWSETSVLGGHKISLERVEISPPACREDRRKCLNGL